MDDVAGGIVCPREHLWYHASMAALAPVTKMAPARASGVEPSLEREATSLRSWAGQPGVVFAHGGAVHSALEAAEPKRNLH